MSVNPDAMMDPENMSRPSQVILPSTIDHELQPDAMRGSEHFFRMVKDGEGNDIPTNDIEEQRREFHRRAQGTPVTTEPREPQQIRVTAPERIVGTPQQRQYLVPQQVQPGPESLTPPPAPVGPQQSNEPLMQPEERPTGEMAGTTPVSGSPGQAEEETTET
jgi:hypothetical protein